MRFNLIPIRTLAAVLVSLTASAAASGVTVNVSSPSNNYKGTSPVHVTAKASSNAAISGWVVYIDSQIAYRAGWQPSIDISITMANGSHQLVVRAWDATGAYGDSWENLTVTDGLPTPPDNAVLVDQIQKRSGWNWCHDKGCAGGSGEGAYWMAQNQRTPSKTGASAEFFNSGVWANALWWNKFGANDSAHNFLWDFWVYLDSAYLTAAQTTEYDVFQFVNGYNYMMGTQCNVAGGVWDTWNGASGRWIHSSVKCPKFSPNTWHHIQMYVTTNTTKRQYTYQTLVVDGQVSPMNITGNAAFTGWSHNIGAQWQLDVNATGAGYHQWMDNAKLWFW